MDSHTLQEVLGNSSFHPVASPSPTVADTSSNTVNISVTNETTSSPNQTEHSIDSGISSLEQSVDSKDQSLEVLETTELDSLLMPPPLPSLSGGQQAAVTNVIGPRPTLASLGIKESIEECLSSPPGAVTRLS